MLKLTKKADYGLIALRHLSAQTPGGAWVAASAKEIADSYRIPLPLLSKVLQKLVHSGMLTSEQGANGGYHLARPPHEITALEVIRTIDGPIILTHCFTEHEGSKQCGQSDLCPVREPLRKVHEGILRLLAGITVADLSLADMPIPSINPMVSGIQPMRLGSEPR
jgi:Rrf2 family protein